MKFKHGDKVRIINYGHIIYEHKKSGMNLSYPIISENETTFCKDMNPELIGQQGIIRIAEITQGRPQYALDGIPEKAAWYNEDQLELINENPIKFSITNDSSYQGKKILDGWEAEWKIDGHKLVTGHKILYLPKYSLWERFLVWIKIKKTEQGIYKVTKIGNENHTN